MIGACNITSSRCPLSGTIVLLTPLLEDKAKMFIAVLIQIGSIQARQNLPVLLTEVRKSKRNTHPPKLNAQKNGMLTGCNRPMRIRDGKCNYGPRDSGPKRRIELWGFKLRPHPTQAGASKLMYRVG